MIISTAGKGNKSLQGKQRATLEAKQAKRPPNQLTGFRKVKLLQLFRKDFQMFFLKYISATNYF